MPSTILRGITLLATAVLAFAQANSPASIENLRNREGHIAYDILLTRGSERSAVSTNYRFRSGDKFSVRLKLARDAYVYLLSRSISGPAHPSHDRSLNFEITSEAYYTLIYPPSGQRIQKPEQINLLPAGNVSLQMDESTSAEQLLLVISPSMLDLSGIMGFPDDRRVAISKETTRTFTERLVGWWRNAEVESVPAEARKMVIEGGDPAQDSGAALDLDGHAFTGAKTAANDELLGPFHPAAPKSPSLPFLVNIVLVHESQ